MISRPAGSQSNARLQLQADVVSHSPCQNASRPVASALLPLACRSIDEFGWSLQSAAYLKLDVIF